LKDFKKDFEGFLAEGNKKENLKTKYYG